MKKAGFLLIIFFWTTIGFGAEKQNPIDFEVEKLLNKDPSTAGQMRAFSQGYDLWDEELNKAYQDLMSFLENDQEGKTALRNSQRLWIKFREQEFIFLQKLYAKKEGTMYRPMHCASRMEMVKARSRVLRDRLALLKDY